MTKNAEVIHEILRSFSVEQFGQYSQVSENHAMNLEKVFNDMITAKFIELNTDSKTTIPPINKIGEINKI